jgi:hypothetical protein
VASLVNHSSWHFNCRAASLAAILFLFLLATAGGCALFDKDKWNLDRYRDERAVDIEHRLDRSEPIVKNPF